jgi:hypothetical protein
MRIVGDCTGLRTTWDGAWPGTRAARPGDPVPPDVEPLTVPERPADFGWALSFACAAGAPCIMISALEFDAPAVSDADIGNVPPANIGVAHSNAAHETTIDRGIGFLLLTGNSSF